MMFFDYLLLDRSDADKIHTHIMEIEDNLAIIKELMGFD